MDRKTEVLLRQLSFLAQLWVVARDDAERLWIIRQWGESMAFIDPVE